MINTGKVIRQLRKKQGMTQSQLAEKAYLSTTAVGQFEKRDGGLVETFNKLLKALGYELVIMKIHPTPKGVKKDCQW